MDRLRIATTWLGGCSGCHMSFLDLDEWLFDLARVADVVYSPVIDVKEYPRNVDVCLVEGAVANEDNLEQIRLIRERTRILVAFGDCAVTGNVTAMRNPLGNAQPILERAYLDPADLRPRLPSAPGILPALLPRVLPIQEAVAVDYYIPGCPPPADRIKALLEQIASGQTASLADRHLTFG
jgi:NAD-reducing hydrogenase small subunit